MKLRSMLDRNTLLTVAGAAGIAYFLDTRYDRFSDPALGALFGWTLGHPIIGGATAFLMPSRATIGKWRQPALEAAAQPAAIAGGVVRPPAYGGTTDEPAEPGAEESGPSWGEQFQEDRSYDPQEKGRLRARANGHWALLMNHMNLIRVARQAGNATMERHQQILANSEYTMYLQLMLQANALHPRSDTVQPQPMPTP